MNAVLFPGQGSQYPGMGKDLYDTFSCVKEVFRRIDDAVGFKLSQKCFEASKEELKDTLIQQLAIVAASIASYEAFKTKAVELNYVAGLSLGEYSSLYAAGVLELEQVMALVKIRAEAMAKAADANPSGMCAVIGLDQETAAAKQDLGFYIANINAPSQIAISVAHDAMAKVKEALTALGAKVVELEVSGGFHSPFMEMAQKALTEAIDAMDFSDASIPIVSNYTASSHTDAGEIKENLKNQLTHPVLWYKSMDYIAVKGVVRFFETGPSRILRGLMRKINPALKVINIEKTQDIEGILDTQDVA